MNKHLILGTGGHIDHGKTALIGALTGTNTDRLPEEKKRGITIEPGFARLQLDNAELGIVDVPGHEKFVRQMLSGAAGIDIALLVVAADDSIKPQTLEHFEILKLLQLKHGVIAITKCDVIDDPDNWLPLVEEEIREVCRDSFLADAPIVFTSAKTGQGIDELKQALGQLVEQYSGDVDVEHQPFRMPIDRVFVKEGHGTVVTGSVTSGRAANDDQLEIQPGDHAVRIRSLQNHDASVDSIEKGQRAAINLAGVHHETIKRGHELCTPGFLEASRLMFVKLRLLEHLNHPLKDRTRIRLHIGTNEILGQVRLFQQTKIEPGETGLAQIFLAEEAVAVWNQPFVIRRESPVETLGGGHILHPTPNKIRKADDSDIKHLEMLGSTEEADRVEAAFYFAELKQWSEKQLPRVAGVNRWHEPMEHLKQSGALVDLQVSPTRTLTLHRQTLDRVGQRIIKALDRIHDANQRASFFPLDVVKSRFSYVPDTKVLNWVLSNLQKQKQIRLANGRIGLEGRGPQLTKNEQQLHDQIVDQLLAAGVETPTIKQLTQQAAKNKDAVPALLKLAVDNGLLQKVADDYYLHTDTIEHIKQTLREHLASGKGLTMSEIRSILDTSRKYAVPLGEYLDDIGFTQRKDDLRVLASG